VRQIRNPKCEIRIGPGVIFLVALALIVVGVPLAADAQQAAKVWRIGFLGSPASTSAEAFRQGLRELGYEEGQNITTEYRSPHGKVEVMQGLAAELVRLNVDLIFADGTAASLAARDATKKIPIVFAGVGDPVGAGLVSSLARPGGNITGFSTANVQLAPKRLQLLRDVSRRTVSRVGVVVNLADAFNVLALRELEGAARALGITLRPVEVRSPDDFEGAFSRMAAERVEALVVAGGTPVNTYREQIAQLAARTRLPAIYTRREFVEAGGLMSYATDFADQNRRAATYVDKIFKGAKPGDLPVEQPTKFELVINLKTAKALGLTIPQSLLRRADEVIQ
jgi:putative ABC transport system substrate-binding protein